LQKCKEEASKHAKENNKKNKKNEFKQTSSDQPNKTNYLFWVTGGISGVILFGIIIY